MLLIFSANDAHLYVSRNICRHCAEYNVLGMDCEWVGRGTVALLQLATHQGVCVLIRMCILKTLPSELKVGHLMLIEWLKVNILFS